MSNKKILKSSKEEDNLGEPWSYTKAINIIKRYANSDLYHSNNEIRYMVEDAYSRLRVMCYFRYSAKYEEKEITLDNYNK